MGDDELDELVGPSERHVDPALSDPPMRSSSRASQTFA
jgi:hypothetical protein